MSKSGKFVLRVDPKLHGALSSRAKRSGSSLNQLCEGVLEREVLRDIRSGDSPHPEWAKRAGVELWGAVLFGSQARGAARDTSDKDLLWIVNPIQAIDRALYRKVDEAALELGLEYAIHLAHPPQQEAQAVGSLWLEIALDGQILWEEDRNVQQLLSRLRHQIAAGRYQRRAVHGHGYWVRGEGDFNAE